MDAFLHESARQLRDVYLPRLARALEILPAGDLWWRPREDMTSIGNLLLHLEGNVRQWILGGLGGAERSGVPPAQSSGLGGAEVARRRAAEFDAREGAPFDALRATATEAARVIGNLHPARLGEPLSIQGFQTTGLAAVYHVVEHFSWHTGQIVWIAKLRAGAGHGLAFYDDEKLNRA